MNPSPEEGLFQLALAKPAEKRAAFLDVMCDGDAALRQRLDALLAAHDQPNNLVPRHVEAARPTIRLDVDDTRDEAVGQTLGRYKLLEKIGEGGCGVVDVAEQKEPVRRKVALKVIKLGMDTKQVVARFKAERQALAMMDHPNIAKVLNALRLQNTKWQPVVRSGNGLAIWLLDWCETTAFSATAGCPELHDSCVARVPSLIRIRDIPLLTQIHKL